MIEDSSQLLDAKLRGEGEADPALRPQSLAEYIGQQRIRENLSIMIDAARRRGEPLDHVLFSGPPGLGKTTLAYVIAREMGARLTTTSGPVLEKKGDLAAVLTNLEEGDVLFIDEIHRMNRVVEEVLYPAMEDYHIDIILGEGPSARTLQLELKRFTLVGATTRSGLLTNPLRDRFGWVFQLDYYDEPALCDIVTRSAGRLGLEIRPDGASEIARRGRGTPRTVNKLLRRVRDWAQAKADGIIDRAVADQALTFLEIDPRGLDKLDRTMLRLIVENYDGGPVGIETLAAAIGETRDTLEEVHEPFLIQQGLLERTPRGRPATRQAYEWMGRKPPRKSPQEDLFTEES